MSDGPGLDAWLRRAVLGGLVLVLLVGAYLGWRVSRAVSRVERTAAVAQEQIERLGERVVRLEQKAAQAVGVDDLEATLDRMTELRDEFEEPGSLDEHGEREVRHLLATIRRSGLRFEAAGESHGATTFYLKNGAKYRAYKRSLRSAEDFITELAGRSMSGDPYAVVHDDGTREPLDAWLRAALASFRAAEAATQPSVEIR